jgi:septal ring factor EnvC (AmiA/AmiB activator)
MNTTTEAATSNGAYVHVTDIPVTKESEVQAHIKRLETIIHDLSIQVQMTNQDIKSNRAKIKILKEILNEKVD